MSIIQNIRDKYARWAVVAIALSLLGFLLMDAFAGRTGLLSGSPSTTIGTINGRKIDRIEFDNKIKAMEARYEAQGQPIDDNTRQQIMMQAWDQEVTNSIMQAEYDKLGLTVTAKELDDLLYGANPPSDLKSRFTDEKGVYNGVIARQEMNKMLKDPMGKAQVEEYFDYLKSERLKQKYMALLTTSIYFPKWYLEKRNIDYSLMAKVSYITVPYSTIPDSTIKVTDDEIKKFMEDHEAYFELKEETRSYNYVVFNASASRADSLAAYNSLAQLKPQFDSASNVQQFVMTHNSKFPFYDGYTGKSAMQQPNKDSITAAPIGVSYGPYLDVNSNSQERRGLYVISKVIDVKQRPDSVTVRHILIGTNDRNQQTGQVIPIRDDSSAKRQADSVFALIKAGQNFDSLVVKFSTDQGSKDKGGVYENITAGRMVPAFDTYIFDHKTGDRDIVKTDFGYHIIEILSQKNIGPAYKIAYLTADIIPSPETDREAMNQATHFAGESRDLKAFDANYEKNLKGKGVVKSTATSLPMDYNLQGVQANGRGFIKKIYEADKGDVIGPERVGENYVVAIITEVNEPGLQSVSVVRPSIEPIIRNKKKGQQIIKNIGAVTTLEATATKMNQQIQPADSLRITGGPGIGMEPRILGAAFNPANKGKAVTQAIAGQQGVYVLRVDNQFTTPSQTASIEEQRKMEEMQAKQGLMSQMQQYNPVIETLKKAGSVKDNRYKFY